MRQNSISLFTTICIIITLMTGTSAAASTLDVVKKHGAVRCGINPDLPGFATKDAKGNWMGFDVDLCRAVAAAVFGDATKVEFIPVSTADRFEALTAGKYDLLARNTTWTLSRDTTLGVSFVTVNYYDGQGFLINKKSGLRSALELDGATICAEDATTHVQNLKDYFSLNRMKYTLKSYPDTDQALQAFEKGECETLTSDQSALYAFRTQLKEPDQTRVLPEVISKEPLGPVIKEGDDNWAKIVRWSLFIMINAEELGLRSENVDRVRDVTKRPDIRRLLGLEGNNGAGLGLEQDWAYQIIKEVGSYAESFDRNIGNGSPLKMKRGLNAVWRDGGLLYVPPVR